MTPPVESATFDLQPTLVGVTIVLRPLRPDDFELLFSAACDPLIWEQHPEPTRWQRPVFERFFAGGLASGGAFAILESGSGRIIGSSRYYDWNPAEGDVSIGFTFLTRDRWGGVTNGELKQLMLDHAFRFVRVVWFHVGKDNHRSRKAMEKIGATYSHIDSIELNGRPVERVFYRIDAPAVID